MADGRMMSMEGPPSKKPKTSSPTSSRGPDIDLNSFLDEINQALPDELISSPHGLQPPAAQNGGDRKAEDTIQKNKNLSDLLSQETVVQQRPVPGTMGMLRPPYNPGYPSLRGQPASQPLQQRHYVMPPVNRGVVMPGNSGMPYMPGSVPQHPRNSMVSYGPRQGPDFARMGMDNMNRPFGSPVGPYFTNGPDARGSAAAMNSANFQRSAGSYSSGPAMAPFSSGSGHFQMPNEFLNSGPFHAPSGGTMFPGMVNSDMARSFSPGMAVAAPSGSGFPTNSYPMNNMGQTMGNRVPTCTAAGAIPVGGGTMQLVNGSYQQSSTKPLSDVELSSKNNSLNASNCQRLNPCLPADGSSVATKSAVMRPSLPSAMKDSVVSLEASLISPVAPDVSSDVTAVTGSITSQVMLDKRRAIQQQLVLVLHAHKCQRREQQQANNGATVVPCSLPNCATMKNVLKHMTVCQEGRNCQVMHCTHLRQIIAHWKNCVRSDCPICSPLKNATDRRVATTTAPLATGTTVQLTPSSTAVQSSVAPVSDITVSSPASMMRTYLTLGLKPPATLAGSQELGSTAISSRFNGMAALSSAIPDAPSPLASSVSSDGTVRSSKAWHQSVGQDLRNHLVHKLVQAIFPTNPDQSVLRDQRMNHLVQYAKKVEGDMYDSASSREEYYHLLAEKIYKIQKELEEKRMQRMKQDQSAGIVQTGTSFGMPGGPMNPSARSSSPMSPLDYADTLIQSEVEMGHVNSPHNSHQQSYTLSHPNSAGMVRSQHYPAGNMEPSDLNMMTRFRGQQYPIPGNNLRPDMYQGNMQGPGGRLLSPRSGVTAVPYNCTDSQQTLYSSTYRPAVEQNAYNRVVVPDVMNRQRYDSPVASSAMPDSLPSHDQLSTLTVPSSAASQPLLHHIPISLSAAPANDIPQPLSLQPLSSLSSSPRSPKGVVDKPLSEPHSPTCIPNGDHLLDSNCSPVTNMVGVVEQPSPEVVVVKPEIQHEDVTDDDEELVIKQKLSPVGALNGFGTEDITDDEEVDVKPLEQIDVKLEIKTEVNECAGVEGDVESVKCEIKEETDSNAMPDESVAVVKEEIKTEETDVVIKTEVNEEETSEIIADKVTSSVADEPPGKKVWKPAELKQALMPTLDKLSSLDPESQPFLYPVDPIILGIPDYFEVVKNPIDLSTIRNKLEMGEYADAWQYINDIQLMFDNAWLYNRKTSKVYKYCSKLAEVFEADIDGAMQSLGYCCGRKYVFSPQVLCCFGKQLCAIARDTVYYNYHDRYMYCEKCFNEIPGDDIEMADDPSQPGLRIKKEQFVKEKNDKLEYEPFVDCLECGRKMHKICVLHLEQIWPSGFICEPCRVRTNQKRKDNKYSAKRLPPTKLGTYLETRVNALLKRKDAGAGEVTIRVLSSYDKAVEVKAGMRSRYVESGEMCDRFPYRVKAMFAFEEIDGVDVCFFGMHVQEYGSDCAAPNSRRVYIAYLDSVHFFQPKQFRTAVYHEILIGYMDYAKSLGYQTAHIWACPPSEGDDYIFHCHPPEQKIPKPKRLQDWYRKMMDKAVTDRVIFDYKDIWKDAVENNLQSVTEMPYFEGDFWPNILEESIKEIEQEELEKRRREEEEAAADTDDGESSVHGDRVEMQQFAGKKKGQKSGNTKKKNSKSKKVSSRKTKSGGTDLAGKLLSTMDKHKEGFFVIRLQQPNIELQEIKDPDPLMNCDLMDGRDAFLTLSRDKHYEFSSLRRAMYSSIGLLYELHTQARDSFIYNCNSCKASVETRYHCPTCDDFDLCVSCYANTDHPHRMIKLGLDLDDGSGSRSSANAAAPKGSDPSKQGESAAEVRRTPIQVYTTALAHAAQCRNAYCRTPNCSRMRTLVSHLRSCERVRKGCNTCRQMMPLCCHHARTCTETRCSVPYCQQIREKQEIRRREQEFAQKRLLRRRMLNMQHVAESVAPQSAGNGNGNGNDERGSTPQPPVPEPPSGDKLTHHRIAGKSPPPSAALQAARQAEQAAQRQASQASSMPAMMQQQQQQQPHMRQYMSPQHSFEGWPQMSYGVSPGQHGLVNPASSQEELMYRQNVMMTSNIGDAGQPMQQQPIGQQMTQQLSKTPALQELLKRLKSPNSPQQQQEVQTILKTNPEVMATAIKQKHISQQQHAAGPINPQIMAGGVVSGPQMRPVMSPVNHSVSMPMHQMGSVMTGPSASGMTANPAAGTGITGSMMAGGQLSMSMNSGPMGPSGMTGQMCTSESMVDDAGRQMMMSPDQAQMQRIFWMQQQQPHQQQQHQMIRTYHPQQGPSPDYTHFQQQHAMQRPGAAQYGTGAGVPPIQRLRMNIPNAAGGTSPMMQGYSSNDSVRGLMPMPGGLNSQQQQMMQMQRRTQMPQQMRCQMPMPPASMMDTGTPQMVPPSAAMAGSRAAVKRPPPPVYGDTVLTHSGPRPIIGPVAVGNDPRLNQYAPADLAAVRMRFKHPGSGADFPMAPITATDVVRYQHDMRYGDPGGNI